MFRCSFQRTHLHQDHRKEQQDILKTNNRHFAEIGTASVRLFVAFYKGMPYDLSTDTYLPESAAVILRARNLSSEQAAYLAAHTVPNPGTAPATSAPQAAPRRHVRCAGPAPVEP